MTEMQTTTVARRQKIFDRVSAHLIKQREKSAKPDGECLYRGPRGLKCAIGILLSDKDAKSFDVTAFSLDPVIRALGLPEEDGVFLDRLQRVHDDYEVTDWVDRLVRVAGRYKLDLTGLNAALRSLT